MALISWNKENGVADEQKKKMPFKSCQNGFVSPVTIYYFLFIPWNPSALSIFLLDAFNADSTLYRKSFPFF